MRLWEEMEELKQEAIAEGRTEGYADNIRKLMKNMGMTLEQAMNVFEIPEEERQVYREKIESQNRMKQGQSH